MASPFDPTLGANEKPEIRDNIKLTPSRILDSNKSIAPSTVSSIATNLLPEQYSFNHHTATEMDRMSSNIKDSSTSITASSLPMTSSTVDTCLVSKYESDEEHLCDAINLVQMDGIGSQIVTLSGDRATAPVAPFTPTPISAKPPSNNRMNELETWDVHHLTDLKEFGSPTMTSADLQTTVPVVCTAISTNMLSVDRLNELNLPELHEIDSATAASTIAALKQENKQGKSEIVRLKQTVSLLQLVGSPSTFPVMIMDGNLKFSLALSRLFPEHRFVTCVHETLEAFLSIHRMDGQRRIEKLKQLAPRLTLHFGVNASEFGTVPLGKYNRILFTFPQLESGPETPQIMVDRFLSKMKHFLTPSGRICVTIKEDKSEFADLFPSSFPVLTRENSFFPSTIRLNDNSWDLIRGAHEHWLQCDSLMPFYPHLFVDEPSTSSYHHYGVTYVFMSPSAEALPFVPRPGMVNVLLPVDRIEIKITKQTEEENLWEPFITKLRHFGELPVVIDPCEIEGKRLVSPETGNETRNYRIFIQYAGKQPFGGVRYSDVITFAAQNLKYHNTRMPFKVEGYTP